MRPRFRAFSRYRPRVLTLVVLFLIAAPITLANLTSEKVYGATLFRGFRGIYGWPLTWHWHDIMYTMSAPVIVSWDYNATRLAGNVALWLVMLAVPASACEWLLRRYRLRLRWSLRTMLAAVAVASACCAWFAAVRNRAKLQDSFIAEFKQRRQRVVVERPGPKWLQFVVPDNFRRRIIGVDTRTGGTLRESDEAFVVRLRQFPRLRFLNLNVEQLTPAMIATLHDLRELRWLYIDEDQPSRESLAALGQLTQLEVIYFDRPEFTRDSLPLLAGLTNLKTLSVEFCHVEGVFSQMPALPQLEAIHVVFSSVSGPDLRRLAVLPRLKALDLKYADFGADADFLDLAGLNSLEELTVDGDIVSAAGLKSLAAIKNLKALHITERVASFDESEAQAAIKLDDGEEFRVLEREIEGFRHALQNLRQSHPGIVIDGNGYAIDRSHERQPPWDAIAYYDPRKPPWDDVEPLEVFSTWLPARFAWAPPGFLSQVGAQASGPAGGSAQADAEAEE